MQNSDPVTNKFIASLFSYVYSRNSLYAIYSPCRTERCIICAHIDARSGLPGCEQNDALQLSAPHANRKWGSTPHVYEINFVDPRDEAMWVRGLDSPGLMYSMILAQSWLWPCRRTMYQAGPVLWTWPAGPGRTDKEQWSIKIWGRTLHVEISYVEGWGIVGKRAWPPGPHV